MTTLILASTNTSFLDLLSRRLSFEADLDIVALCHDSEDLLNQVSIHQPLVVLLATNLPGYGQLTSSIKMLSPSTEVAWIASEEVRDLWRQASYCGARDILSIEQVLK